MEFLFNEMTEQTTKHQNRFNFQFIDKMKFMLNKIDRKMS